MLLVAVATSEAVSPYVDLKAQAKLEEGMSPEEARYAARREVRECTSSPRGEPRYVGREFVRYLA